MGVLALPEKINEYLALVCRQIRWKRALPDLRRELGTHLLEQRDACIEAGMTEDEAEAEAVRQMGDGVALGRELDSVHRPREQWLLLCAAAVLTVFGAWLRLWAGANVPRVAAFAVAAFAALAITYFTDYRALARRGGWICLAVLGAAVLSLAAFPPVDGIHRKTVYLVQLFPAAYALGVYALRRWKRWGFYAALILAVVMAVCSACVPYLFGAVFVVFSAAITLLCAVQKGWFPVHRGAARAGIVSGTLALCAAGLYVARSRILVALDPSSEAMGRGYQGCAVRQTLRSSARWGAAATQTPLPGGGAEFLLARFARGYGLVPLVLACIALSALFAVVLIRAARQRHAFGSVLALAALAMPVGNLTASIAANAGYVLFSAYCPFVSGSVHTVIDMLLLGLALSVLRQEQLGEDGPAPVRQGPAARRIRWQDGVLTIDLNRKADGGEQLRRA